MWLRVRPIERTMESTNSKYKIGDAVMVAPKIPPAIRARRIISEENGALSARFTVSGECQRPPWYS
jgi:hypothetical protein